MEIIKKSTSCFAFKFVLSITNTSTSRLGKYLLKTLKKSLLIYNFKSVNITIKHKIRVHYDIPWVLTWIGICTIKITEVTNLILFFRVQLSCDIFNPGCHVLSVTPTVTTVQPSTVLVWFGALRYLVGTPGSSTGSIEYTRVFVFFIHYEMMWSDTKLSTIIIVTSMSGYCSKNNDFLCSRWNRKFKLSFAASIVILIEFTTAE